MIYLLDTQAFLWLDSSPASLSPKAREACQNPDNLLWVSVGSIWEIQIKLGLGKIKIATPLAELIASQSRVNGIQILSATLAHILELNSLPLIHRDPFDRLIISQAKCEDWTIISSDAVFPHYPVTVVW